VYLAQETSIAKFAAITVLAERKLSPENLRLLRAIIKVSKSAQKDLDKLARRIWGASEDIPDALLLADPRLLDGVIDGILFYCKNDFGAIISRFSRIAGWGVLLKFIMMGHIANQEQQLYVQLCQEPKIAEKLRRHD
jgi:hypothetical protein